MIFKRVVVAVDFSEHSLNALETALNLVADGEAVLYLVHVVPVEVGIDPMGVLRREAHKLRDDAMLRLDNLLKDHADPKVQVEKIVLGGDSAAAVSAFAREKDADLIVAGSHGRKGLSRLLLGSTSQALLREAPCQVLVVKPRSPREAGGDRSEDASGSTG